MRVGYVSLSIALPTSSPLKKIFSKEIKKAYKAKNFVDHAS